MTPTWWICGSLVHFLDECHLHGVSKSGLVNVCLQWRSPRAWSSGTLSEDSNWWGRNLPPINFAWTKSRKRQRFSESWSVNTGWMDAGEVWQLKGTNFSGFTTCIILMSLFSASLSIFADWSFLWQHVYNFVLRHTTLKVLFGGRSEVGGLNKGRDLCVFRYPFCGHIVQFHRRGHRTMARQGGGRGQIWEVAELILSWAEFPSEADMGKITRNIGDLEIRTKAYRAAVHE